MISRHVDDPGGPALGHRASVASLLEDLRLGRREVFDALFSLVYEELRELAHPQRNAASVAALLLTTECVVVEKKEEEKAPPMPPGGGMGGMY